MVKTMKEFLYAADVALVGYIWKVKEEYVKWKKVLGSKWFKVNDNITKAMEIGTKSSREVAISRAIPGLNSEAAPPHVVRGDSWMPTDGSSPWSWGYQTAICIYDWFEIYCRFSRILIVIGLTALTWIAVHAVRPSKGREGITS